jgi:crotonobetainyl-CoA:carnitine CoA-transferase CaiB-like acyl-CoA transferase
MTEAGTLARGPGEMMGNAGPGMLAGLRVIEVADERAEYTGLLLAGLGAEVVKIEPPEGNATRRIGPFLEDQPGPERSLFFWNYNRNKKSVVLDLREPPARRKLRCAQRSAGTRPRSAQRALPATRHRADDAVWR